MEAGGAVSAPRTRAALGGEVFVPAVAMHEALTLGPQLGDEIARDPIGLAAMRAVHVDQAGVAGGRAMAREVRRELPRLAPQAVDFDVRGTTKRALTPPDHLRVPRLREPHAALAAPLRAVEIDDLFVFVQAVVGGKELVAVAAAADALEVDSEVAVKPVPRSSALGPAPKAKPRYGGRDRRSP
jgi:hypothetical protein